MKKKATAAIITRRQFREILKSNEIAFKKMVFVEAALQEQRDIIVTFPIVFHTTREALRELTRGVRELDGHVAELIRTVKGLGGTGAKDAAGSKQRRDRRQKPKRV